MLRQFKTKAVLSSKRAALNGTLATTKLAERSKTGALPLALKLLTPCQPHRIVLLGRSLSGHRVSKLPRKTRLQPLCPAARVRVLPAPAGRRARRGRAAARTRCAGLGRGRRRHPPHRSRGVHLASPPQNLHENLLPPRAAPRPLLWVSRRRLRGVANYDHTDTELKPTRWPRPRGPSPSHSHRPPWPRPSQSVRERRYIRGQYPSRPTKMYQSLKRPTSQLERRYRRSGARRSLFISLNFKNLLVCRGCCFSCLA